jgi:hypothetical protein
LTVDELAGFAERIALRTPQESAGILRRDIRARPSGRSLGILQWAAAIMGHEEPDALADQELSRIFVSFKLRDAGLAEQVLSTHGIEYVVTVEPFGRTLFGSARNGAVFSVRQDQAERVATLLSASGLGSGIIGPDDDPHAAP